MSAALLLPQSRRILAYRDPVDLRKSIDGLIGLVRGVLGEDPLSGCIYVFFNRRGNYLKLLVWDRTGYCLLAKRLEHGRFHLPSDASRQIISDQMFRLLLDGIPLGKRSKMR